MVEFDEIDPAAKTLMIATGYSLESWGGAGKGSRDRWRKCARAVVSALSVGHRIPASGDQSERIVVPVETFKRGMFFLDAAVTSYHDHVARPGKRGRIDLIFASRIKDWQKCVDAMLAALTQKDSSDAG